MKTIVRTKLLGDKIEARDYELFKDDVKLILCKDKDYKKCLHVGEEYMPLSIAQQKKGKVVNTQRSKFYPYSYYKIYTYLWKPNKIESMQLKDKKITFEGNVAYIE